MKNLDVNELEMIQGGGPVGICGIGVGLVCAALFTGGATAYVGAVIIGLSCLSSDTTQHS